MRRSTLNYIKNVAAEDPTCHCCKLKLHLDLPLCPGGKSVNTSTIHTFFMPFIFFLDFEHMLTPQTHTYNHLHTNLSGPYAGLEHLWPIPISAMQTRQRSVKNALLLQETPQLTGYERTQPQAWETNARAHTHTHTHTQTHSLTRTRDRCHTYAVCA